MRSRRQFVRLSLTALIPSARALAVRPEPAGRPRVALQSAPRVWLPLARTSELPPLLDDPSLLGPATGTAAQASAWLAPRAAVVPPPEGYTAYDIAENIVRAYQLHGEAAGLDWFLAIAQMAHETGSLTNFWSWRPQRNPAGIGVTGAWRTDQPADTAGWAYNTQRQRWEAGISFPTWESHAVPAHLGRLLAYALRDDQASDGQRQMIAYALSYRSLLSEYRGSAPTITGLNGRWAWPGDNYG